MKQLKEKVLFAYNGRIETDGNGAYFGNELNDTLVERYRCLAKHVSFLVRKRLVSDKDKKYLQKFNSGDFSVITVPEFNSPLKFIKNINTINEIIKESVMDCDILVARLPSTIGRKAISFAKKFEKPYLVEVVGCPWDALWNHSFLGKILAPYAYCKMRTIVKQAPFVLYVTSSFLQKRYPNYNNAVGISDVILKSKTNPNTFERINRFNSFRNANAPLIIATAAAVDVKYKGHGLVFRTLKILKQQGIRAKYYVLGKGDQQNLKLLAKKLNIEDDVVFFGQLPHKDVFSWLEKVDLYIQPSRQEGLPRALVEAMSMGCVCIGTPTGGIPELLSEDMITDAYSPKSLAFMIANLTPEKFKSESLKNISTSALFYFDLLEMRRKAFYDEFLRSI
jgi:glycosyltransferase involved in cell wall biosynthesis